MDWKTYDWEKPFPEDAVVAGGDQNGHYYYVARSLDNGTDKIPGVAMRSEGLFRFCRGGQVVENPEAQFEVLCGYKHRWVSSRGVNQEGLRKAFPGGRDTNGEPLYIGRVKKGNGSLICGKILASNGFLYVADGDGEAVIKSDYEILFLRHPKSTRAL